MEAKKSAVCIDYARESYVISERFWNESGDQTRSIDANSGFSIDQGMLFVNVKTAQRFKSETKLDTPHPVELRVSLGDVRRFTSGPDDQHVHFELPPGMTTDDLRRFGEQLSAAISNAADETDRYFKCRKHRKRFDGFVSADVYRDRR